MIAKSPCQHCQTPIEFDVEHANSFVPCPVCGKQTRLLLSSQSKTVVRDLAAKHQSFRLTPAIEKIEGQLNGCDSCGTNISRKALFCPHCGHPGQIPFRMVLNVVGSVLLAMLLFYLLGEILGYALKL